MEEIYIFGAGGFAVEVAYLIGETGQYKIAAFIDRNAADSIYIEDSEIPVISEDDFSGLDGDSKRKATIAIANNIVVKKIADRFQSQCEFPNIIHPSFKT